MMVTSEEVAALRFALTRDTEGFDRLDVAFPLEWTAGLPALMAHAFIAAARQYFPPGWTAADVIRFVGQLRARDQGSFSDVSAGAAEQMLLSALRGQPMHDEFDEADKGYTQIAVLSELVRSLDRHQLDALLQQARTQADSWLAGKRWQLLTSSSRRCALS